MFSVSEAHIDVVNNLDSLVGLVDVKLYGKYLPVDDFTSPDPDVKPSDFKPGDTRNVIPDHKYSKELHAMVEAIERNKQTAVAVLHSQLSNFITSYCFRTRISNLQSLLSYLSVS